MPTDAATVKNIFFAALDQATPADRVAFLDSVCAGDAGLRQRVEALLSAHGSSDSFPDFLGLMSPDATQAHQAAAEDTSSHPPDCVGPYKVLSEVGRGGMGVVYKARDESLDRVVAVKVLAPEYANNATARKRFLREAKAVAAVVHEHVVTVHAVEERDAVPYLVMQFVAGISLEERLTRSGPLETKEILRIGMQAVSGLAAAHAQGIVHRDIKPANILLENGIERVKITDFGLARAVDDVRVTQSGVIAGTPLFMSPEQAEGKTVDGRSDLFSLGSVLYALSTGHAPFRASGTIAVMKRVVEDTPRPIREINPDIPDWLEAIISKLMAKRPEDRFPSAKEVTDLLERCLAHVQQPGQVPRPAFVQAPATQPSEASARNMEQAATLLTTLVLCALISGAGISACEYFVPTSGLWAAVGVCVLGVVLEMVSRRIPRLAVQRQGIVHPIPGSAFLIGVPGVVFAGLLVTSSHQVGWQLPVVFSVAAILLIGVLLGLSAAVSRLTAQAKPATTSQPDGRNSPRIPSNE